MNGGGWRRWFLARGLATLGWFVVVAPIAGGCSSESDREPTVATTTAALTGTGGSGGAGGSAGAAGAGTGGGLSTAALELRVLTNSCGANQAQQFFQVTNRGTTSVKLSDLSIRFWIDDTTGKTVTPQVTYGGCVTGVNGNPSCVHAASAVSETAKAFSP
ncbi:MAG TPA: cellulose binding domain-containing protein, partial [Polyangiaceae bacterium]|nr:cellulose binding domain-containing protein [Polyangiaceae bacterium]